MHFRQNLAGVVQIILKFYLFNLQALENFQVLFFMLRRFQARILQYEKDKQLWHRIFPLKEDNMATRRKLNLINGVIDTECGICTYRTTSSFEMACFPDLTTVPLLPFPDDGDDWDDYEQAE